MCQYGNRCIFIHEISESRLPVAQQEQLKKLLAQQPLAAAARSISNQGIAGQKCSRVMRNGKEDNVLDIKEICLVMANGVASSPLEVDPDSIFGDMDEDEFNLMSNDEQWSSRNAGNHCRNRLNAFQKRFCNSNCDREVVSNKFANITPFPVEQNFGNCRLTSDPMLSEHSDHDVETDIEISSSPSPSINGYSSVNGEAKFNLM